MASHTPFSSETGSRHLTFHLSPEDIRRAGEITLAGVIEGKLAKGQYEDKVDKPTPRRLYKEGLSQWARDIIDMALDSGMRVMDYDGILQPQIYLSPYSEWHKPPFMELAGKELFIKVPHNEYGHILHLRLECSYWQYANPNDPKETISMLFYAPKPPENTDGN